LKVLAARARLSGGELAPRLRTFARRLRLALAVQVGERAALLALADALLLGQGVFAALLGGGEADDFYLWTALLPIVVLAPPALSDLVAVEKRSGTLDLTLSLPAAETILLLRAGAIAALAWLQGSLVMTVVWWSEPEVVPLLGALVHLAALCTFLAAAGLFAALHTGNAGGAWAGTLALLAVLAPWSLFNPVPSRLTAAAAESPWIAPGGAAALAVLSGATFLSIAYSLRRLRRPEVLSR
jgi:hypothetical protein